MSYKDKLNDFEYKALRNSLNKKFKILNIIHYNVPTNRHCYAAFYRYKKFIVPVIAIYPAHLKKTDQNIFAIFSSTFEKLLMQSKKLANFDFYLDRPVSRADTNRVAHSLDKLMRAQIEAYTAAIPITRDVYSFDGIEQKCLVMLKNGSTPMEVYNSIMNLSDINEDFILNYLANDANLKEL